MSWRIPNLWQGDECWILGGGPSLARQFEIPEELIAKVQSGEVSVKEYSPYMEAIHNKHIIGVNSAYLLGDWVDVVFFGDRRWYFSNRERLFAFPGLKVSCAPALNNEKYKEENIKFVHRDRQGRGIVKTHKSISWNSNSGAAAISLAASFGVNKIILVGFDMDLDSNGCQHFHGMYVTRGDRRNARKLPFSRHLIGFEQIRRDARRLRIQIINASPDSKITTLHKTTVKDILNGKKETSVQERAMAPGYDI